MAGALSSFKTDHHYVAGMGLVAIGLLGIAGSLTGSLAAMLAGLFCNSGNPGSYTNTALYDTGKAGGSGNASIPNAPPVQTTPAGLLKQTANPINFLPTLIP